MAKVTLPVGKWHLGDGGPSVVRMAVTHKHTGRKKTCYTGLFWRVLQKTLQIFAVVAASKDCRYPCFS